MNTKYSRHERICNLHSLPLPGFDFGVLKVRICNVEVEIISLFLWEITNKCIYWCVFLLYYNQCRLLHVPAVYCGQDGWLKHVGDYTYYNTINIHIIICTCWLFLIRNKSMVGNHLKYSFLTNAPHVLVDFVVFPPGHGRSVTDFCGWGTHEARLHCPDDVSGDIGGCSARRALNPL